MVAPTFSLSAITEEHRSLLLVLAVAGDFCSPSDLEKLEGLSTTRGFEPIGRTPHFWRHLLQDWAELGLVQSREDYDGKSYLLPRPLAHQVLSTADPAVLDRLQEALARHARHRGRFLPELARVSVYLGDTAQFLSTMTFAGDRDWARLFGADPQPDVVELVPESVRETYLLHLAENALCLESPMPRVIWGAPSANFDAYRIAALALRGEISPDSDLLVGLDPDSDATGRLHAALALVSLASNGAKAAQAHGARALALSAGRQRYPTLRGALGHWSALCALSGSPEECAMGELYVRGVDGEPLRALGYTEELLGVFVDWHNAGSDEPVRFYDVNFERHEWSHLTWLMRAVLVRWNAIDERGVSGEDEAIADALGAYGYEWACAEYTALVQRGDRGSQSTLASMYRAKPDWERGLDRLSGFASKQDRVAAPKPAAGEQRIAWILSRKGEDISLGARIQRRTRKGYTKGRKAAVSGLVKRRDEAWMDDRDRAVLAAADRLPSRSYDDIGEYVLGEGALLALAGHPRVYWDKTLLPVEVVREKPGIRVSRDDDGIQISASPWRDQTGPWAVRDGTRLRVFYVDEQHVTLCTTIGASGITLPADAEPRLASVLGRLSKNISLESDVVPEGIEIEEVESCSQLIVQLRRDRDVLRARIAVRPLGKSGPLFDAGRGSEVVVTEIDGAPTQTRRDLSQELAREQELFRSCPTLEEAEVRDNHYTITGLSGCLELLRELHAMGDEVICLWSEGEPVRLDLSADMDGLRIRFGDTNAWLSADIEVQVSDTITLKAHDLVARMVDGSSSFVQLDDGRFVALSEELSRKLGELPALGKLGKAGLTLAPASAFALSAWLGDLETHKGVHGARLAAERLAKVREAASINVAVPTAFEAELRPYQLDAFAWLERLAHWGGGALLCDDMGLGKTVQMLAVLVERASQGPAMVVAPVSVGPHWQSLMRRFAPTLVCRELESTGRADALAELGPRDVLLVSYGLLHTEQELLCSRSFSTIVLDEAQAIKNPRSKRARAAHRLQGEFRVVTTGTPIENHLGELWSIMNFANPGLLGTGKEFAENFAKPIQRDGDREAGARLRRILRPFLLRRTKAQVLEELPPKTEITIDIEPSPEEAEYYAGVRDAMLRELSAGRNRPAHQRMQVLAALMKLRRIACHPQLVDETVQCGSAKQSVFMELVTELREAGHRILVFSQFVGHLSIARQSLDDAKISYQYLDGQTSLAKRKQAVSAFQGGAGDVFLISLKAGGVGLDLTGADYVIHLDPWWNPAVEDQASDRAHRIGQKRPVTVYRLVTKGTVEQRVLDLHSRKRQLAEDLISGSESATPMGVDELVDLMRDLGESR